MELSLQNSSCFLLHFFIATNIANKPLSDCITSPKTILPFHFSPKPTAKRETKRQQTKQLQFHKINTKLLQRTYVALLLFQRQSKLPSRHLLIHPLEQTIKFICSSLNVTNPKKSESITILHPQANKIFQTYRNSLIFRLQVLSVLFKISDNPCTFV